MGKLALSLLRTSQTLASWLGYIGLAGEYLLLALLFSKTFLELSAVQTLIGPKQHLEPILPTEVSAPGMTTNSLPGWIVALVAAIIFIAMLYGMYRMLTKDVPETKEKAEQAVQVLARKTLQKIEHGKKMSKKRSVLLTMRMTYWIKIVIVLVPLVALLVFWNVQMIVSRPAAFVCLGVIALFTLCWFTLERFLAERLASSK